MREFFIRFSDQASCLWLVYVLAFFVWRLIPFLCLGTGFNFVSVSTAVFFCLEIGIWLLEFLNLMPGYSVTLFRISRSSL